MQKALPTILQIIAIRGERYFVSDLCVKMQVTLQYLILNVDMIFGMCQNEARTAICLSTFRKQVTDGLLNNEMQMRKHALFA